MPRRICISFSVFLVPCSVQSRNPSNSCTANRVNPPSALVANVGRPLDAPVNPRPGTPLRHRAALFHRCPLAALQQTLIGIVATCDNQGVNNCRELGQPPALLESIGFQPNRIWRVPLRIEFRRKEMSNDRLWVVRYPLSP